MNTTISAYSYALSELRTPGTYFYFIHTVEKLETIDQCKSYLKILEVDLKKIEYHHPWSYLKNIRQAKIDLVNQKIFELRLEKELENLN